MRGFVQPESARLPLQPLMVIAETKVFGQEQQLFAQEDSIKVSIPTFPLAMFSSPGMSPVEAGDTANASAESESKKFGQAAEAREQRLVDDWSDYDGSTIYNAVPEPRWCTYVQRYRYRQGRLIWKVSCVDYQCSAQGKWESPGIPAECCIKELRRLDATRLDAPVESHWTQAEKFTALSKALTDLDGVLVEPQHRPKLMDHVVDVLKVFAVQPSKYAVAEKGSADVTELGEAKLSEYLDTLQHDGSNSGILPKERYLLYLVLDEMQRRVEDRAEELQQLNDLTSAHDAQ